MWWWDKAHPLAVYMDKRVVPAGAAQNNRRWRLSPDIVGDFKELPFEDMSFQLVLFDPPHVIRDECLGNLTIQYGALPRDTEQDELRLGFSECWRVLAPGGTLVFKWAGTLDRVKAHFPAEPIVGTRSTAKGISARWFIFYKPLDVAALDIVLRCPECGVPLELGHDCLAAVPA
jgi:SAM-dependent methyltransferase